MKPKQKQTALLLAVLATEIILFNNFLKYALMDLVCPGATDCITTKLLLIKMIIIILLVLIVGWLLNKLRKIHKEPLYVVYLIKGFHVKGSDLIGVLNVLFVLCSAAWIGSEIYMQNMDGYLNALIYTGFLLLYPLIVANCFLPKLNSEEKFHSKVLIYAISNIEEKFLKPSMDEMNEKFNDRWLDQVFYENGIIKRTPNGVPWGPWGNFDPIRKSIIDHNASFKEIVLIASSEVSEKIDKLSNEFKPITLLQNFLATNYPDKKVKVSVRSEDISGNDMKMNIVGIKNILNSLNSNKIEDGDIIFNITGGTAAITGAMILNAIPYDRKAEYARQDTGVIEEIPLDIYDVKDLWYELLEKVG